MGSTSDRPDSESQHSSIGSSEELITAALGTVADLPARRYRREHDVAKRELDVVRLEASAEAIGLSALTISPEIRVFHDPASALLFYKNMSSSLLYLDRAVTNRKPLTKAILSRAGLPVARGTEAGTADEVRAGFTALGTAAVVKPVTGSGGRDVHTHLTSAEDAAAAAEPILASGRNVLVEEMVTGIDLRVTVVDGRTVGATLRVPANVIGDGRSTITELVEAKNVLRESSDYVRHQQIELGPDKEHYLAAQGYSTATVPAQGQRVFLHYVANISAGGDSYEVLERLHPDLADLAVQAAAQFPSSLHAGVDLLLERIDAPLASQRVIICEVNLNNELPLHLYPVYGPSSPVDDLVIAAHWHKEAHIPFSAWRKDEAPGRVDVPLAELAELVATAAPNKGRPAEGLAGRPDAGPRQLDSDLLQSALDAAAPPGTSVRPADDSRFVHLRTEDSERIAERSGRTLIAGAIAADPALMHRVARTSGIPVMGRHWFRSSQKEKALERVDRRWRTWTLRLPGRGSRMRSIRIDSVADLEAAWAQVPTTGRFRLVETPTETACVLLMAGQRLLGAQLLAPLTVTGDGSASVATLLERELTLRQDHPVLHHFSGDLTVDAVLAGADPAAVPAPGERLRLGSSPRLVDGAATVGLSTLPWPGLKDYAARYMSALGNPGLATLTFAPRQRSATEAAWALWRFYTDPSLATFRFPLTGPGFDAFPAVAERILSGPSRRI